MADKQEHTGSAGAHSGQEPATDRPTASKPAEAVREPSGAAAQPPPRAQPEASAPAGAAPVTPPPVGRPGGASEAPASPAEPASKPADAKAAASASTSAPAASSAAPSGASAAGAAARESGARRVDGPPPPPPARRGASWAAMVASGLIGGAVVALAAGLYGWLAQSSEDGATNVLLARLGAVELVVQDLNARAPTPPAEPQAATEPQAAMGFAERLAKVEAALAAAPGPGARDSSGPASDPALAPRLEAVEASAKSLADALTRLERRADESAAALQDARARGDAAPAPSGPPPVGKSEFDTLASRVDGLQQALSQSTGSLQSSLSQTTSSLQQAIERQSMSVMDRSVRLALVASGIKSAVMRSAPYAGELNAAKALGADPQAVAALEPFAASGVPSAETLGRELATLAPRLTPPESRLPPDSGYLDRLQAHADRLVRIRPAGGAAGEDPGAIIDRIEAKAKQGDIAGALAELRKLPEAARAPAAAWINKAEARQAATAAAQRIETSALAALSNQ